MLYSNHYVNIEGKYWNVYALYLTFYAYLMCILYTEFLYIALNTIVECTIISYILLSSLCTQNNIKCTKTSYIMHKTYQIRKC